MINKPLIFLHLPKTGGITFRQFMTNLFPADATLHNAHQVKTAELERPSYQFITGHFGYDYVKKNNINGDIITFLREPIKRVISNFYFWKQDIIFETFSKQKEWPGIENEKTTRRILETCRKHDLESLLKYENNFVLDHLSNIQTRIIGGFDYNSYDKLTINLDTALKNLESCYFFGITEKMNESIKMLFQKKGWPVIYPEEVLNKTTNKIEYEDQPDWVIERLKDLNLFDLSLYQHAVDLFERRALENPNSSITLENPNSSIIFPDAGKFSFDQPIFGEGWHGREKIENNYFAWSGPGKITSLELSTLVSKEATLTCYFLFAIHHTVFDGLNIFLNGNLLNYQLLIKDNKLILKALVNSLIMKKANGRLKITFVSKVLYSPRDLNPSSTDTRKLGFALKEIQLTPGA